MSDHQNAKRLLWFPEVQGIRVSGPDSRSWLRGLLTPSMPKPGKGEIRFGWLLERTGKIHSDVWILSDEEDLIVFGFGLGAEQVHELDRRLIMEDAEINPLSSFEIAFVDPKSAADISDKGLSEVQLVGGLSNLVAVITKSKEALESTFSAAGLESSSESEVANYLWEHQLPLWNRGYQADMRPHDTGFERSAIDWDKGCYLGQEAVCMQEMRGKVSKRLFRITGEAALPENGAEISDKDGKKLGKLTFSFQYEKGWRGFALLKIEAGEAGAVLRCGEQILSLL